MGDCCHGAGKRRKVKQVKIYANSYLKVRGWSKKIDDSLDKEFGLKGAKINFRYGIDKVRF